MPRDLAWRRAGVVVPSLLALAVALSPVRAAERYALLVGVNEYQHARLTPLKYAVNDVAELADVLKKAEYQVTLLTDAAGKKDEKLAPTKANIEKRLHEVVRRCQRGDTLLLAFTGHGLQFGAQKDAYYCPVDARPLETETDSLVSISKIYSELEASFAGVKIVLVDACRNDPTPGRGRGLDADSAPSPPKGVGVLFSCSAGQRAFEHDSLKHGVFFHYVLEGLKKEAADRQGRVTFDDLAKYVRQEVPDRVHELFPEQKPDQSPNVKADLAGRPPLLLTLGEAGTASQPDDKPTLRVVAGKTIFRIGDAGMSLEMRVGEDLRWSNKITGKPVAIALSSSGDWVVVATSSGVAMHNAKTGQQIWSRDGITATNVAFSRDGQQVTVTMKEGRSAFDRATGAQR
jgi:hypothetical protein